MSTRIRDEEKGTPGVAPVLAGNEKNPSVAAVSMLTQMQEKGAEEQADPVLFLRISAPSAVAIMGMFLNQTITMSFVGHRLGFQTLAALSIGLSVFNILGQAPLLGFLLTIDTMATQAFGRNQETEELTEILQISWVVSAVAITVVSICFYMLFRLPLVTLLGSDLGNGAADFLECSPPFLVGIVGAITFAKLCRGQRWPSAPTFVNWCMVLCSGYINYYHLPAGSSVCVAARNLAIAQCAGWLVYFPLTYFTPGSLIWKGEFPAFKQALSNKVKVEEYLRIGKANILGLCAEWWVLEVLQVMTSFIGAAEVAALSICLNVLFLLESVAWGISIGTSTLMGNALGAGNGELAESYYWLCVKASFAATSVLGLLLFWQGKALFEGVYTSDEEVLQILIPNLPLIALWQVAYFNQGSLTGAFRGAARPDLSSKITLCCLWGIGMPLAYILAFQLSLGFRGILIGEMVSLWVLTAGLHCAATSSFDWASLADKAHASRIETEQHSNNPGEAHQLTQRYLEEEDPRNSELDCHLPSS